MFMSAAAVQRWLPAIISLLLVSACSDNNNEVSRTPKMDEKRSQYIIAQGSLLYDAVREKRLNDKASIQLPVIVHGYERGWFARSKPDCVKSTRLAVTPKEGAWFNGVLLSVSASTIKGLDRKEPQFHRVEVPGSQLASMIAQPLPKNGQFWIYQEMPEAVKKPAGNFPILQSRVDEFLTGCIDQGERFLLKDFANQCVTSTQGWSVHWSNDRVRPLGGKIVQVQPKAVDKLLETLDGDLYERVRAE